MTKPIGVIHYGLGPIGAAVARAVATRSWLRSIGAVDVRADLVGRELGDVVEAATAPSVRIASALADARPHDADAVLHCTGSSLVAVAPQVLECLDAGLNVVSTCEELSYPWEANAEVARTLDDCAKRRGVTVLATGVNPGFVMDFLPLVLTGVAERVDHVTVRRAQEAGTRRLPLQRKVGAGLTVGEFEEGVRLGRIRHVGLRESVAAIGAALGWQLTRIDESIEPLVAARETASGLGRIPIGAASGVHQIARGWEGSTERVVLVLKMGVGLDDPKDEIELDGLPPMRLTIDRGVPGDVATAAIVANVVARVVAAPPGLRTMVDLPVPLPAPITVQPRATVAPITAETAR